MTHQPYFDSADCDLSAFEALISQSLDPARIPQAAGAEKNIPLYDMPALAGVLEDAAPRRALMGEWAWVLGQGPGVLVLKGACADLDALDGATAVFHDIIAQEAGQGGGDHFAADGANARIWNAAQKLCLTEPEVFARYFGNPVLDAVAEAWLGPGYQMTAQVNLVRPGGKAQDPHRDYHLGFQSQKGIAAFPVHTHRLSPCLTLQGAVAHCDMPVESGPTQLLPFSQLFEPGYLAAHLPAFRDVFARRMVQLPLARGDAVFFNPALFHAAGENRSADIARMANLLQVSSPFGRAMEAMDRDAMCRALYPALSRLRGDGRLSPLAQHAAIAAAAEGYAFPTNLDTDPPSHGAAPVTQADAFRAALAAGHAPEVFFDALAAYTVRRQAREG